jgi:Ca2+/Na+ antiporter
MKRSAVKPTVAKYGIVYGAVFGVIGFMIALYLGIVALLALWTDRNLDFWATYVKGVEVDVPYWVAFIVSIFAPLAVLGNVISEVVRYFV